MSNMENTLSSPTDGQETKETKEVKEVKEAKEATKGVKSGQSEKSEKKKKLIREFKSLAIIISCIFIFRSIFFEPFRIPSGSMIPTLMIGDFILVNKFAYGLKVPFSDISIPLTDIELDPIYVFEKENPQRGDVIVFKYPRDPNINYIKRVVGLPGDTIEIRNKEVFINDELIKTKEISGEEILKDMDDKFKDYNLKFYEARTGEHQHIVQQNEDHYYNVDYEARVIPTDHFFVMGDNRDFSYDSRFWGFVPHKYIKGKAVFVWFSMIFGLGEHAFKARPWRIGNAIK